jgi:hypothetical protein
MPRNNPAADAEVVPKSFNVYDRLGETPMQDSGVDQAVRSDRKSVKLNPHNSRAVEGLKKLQEAKKNVPSRWV